MTEPNTYETTLIATQPHRTKLYLSVYQPKTVLAARVNNASITWGERSIAYDGVTAGSVALVKPDMTMYVGSSAGANDKGRIRVKSIVTGTITVAENSYINWADD